MSSVKDIVDEMREEYLGSCRAHLAEVHSALDASTAPSDDDYEKVQRTVHSIKGSAYTFGLPEMSVLCAAWESEMKRARLDDGVAARLRQWRRFADIYTALLSGAAAPSASPCLAGKTALIWSPFESCRNDLVSRANALAGTVRVAGTDREALIIASNEEIAAIFGDTDCDSELDSSQRARLVGAAAAGLGVPWFCARLLPERRAPFLALGAQPLDDATGVTP